VALGALHGPAELVPISSSAHTTLVPWLVGSRYANLEPDLRKELEVALHAGTTLALIIGGPGSEPSQFPFHRRGVVVFALAVLPAGLVGYMGRTWIERNLGTPASAAAGLTAGALAMAVADRAPQRRAVEALDIGDGVWLGLAQTLALFPGVSRLGATLSALRLREFRRRDAEYLARVIGFPITGGAAIHDVWRLYLDVDRAAGRVLAAGALSSFASGVLSARLLGRRLCGGRSLAPYVAYRLGLTALVIGKLARHRANDLTRSAQARRQSEGSCQSKAGARCARISSHVMKKKTTPDPR
jgi:undecaprenyl-diphosphatase